MDSDHIILLSEGLPDLLPMQDRSPGVHVSDIIKYLCIKFGHYREDTTIVDSTDDDTISAERRTRMQLGAALEWAIIQRYERTYPDEYMVPPEIELDGIYGHPDLLWLPEETVKEIKLTDRSSAGGSSAGEHVPIGCVAANDHPIHSRKFLRDWWQLKAYCHMIGWSTGLLEICHQRGDYKQIRLAHRVWQCEFTSSSLKGNWQMLLNHKTETEDWLATKERELTR